MNAYSSEFHQLRHQAEKGNLPGRGVANTPKLGEELARRWAGVHGAAAAVAGLAQVAVEPGSREAPNFAAIIADTAGWKSDLLRNGLDDIAAFMQSGLTALLAANEAGRNPAAAAFALWTQFEHSRDALLESIFGE